MATKRNKHRTSSTIPVGLGIAAMISLLITFAGTAVCAAMLNEGRLATESVDIVATAITVPGSAAGAFTATMLIKRMRLQMCLAAGGCYYLLLLSMTALFFGGQYEGAGRIALGVLVGCGCVAVLRVFGEKKGSAHRRKKGYR